MFRHVKTSHPLGWARWGDPVLAGVVVAAGVIELMLAPGGVPVGQLAGATVMGAALAWRQRAPIVVLVVVMVALTAQEVAGFDVNLFYTPVALVIAYYSVGAHRDLPRAGLGLALGLGLMAVGTAAEGLPVGEYLFTALIAVAPWAAGAALRARILAATVAEGKAQLAEEQQDQYAAAAVAAERARIARELHDLVAHSVSVMVMQAGALRRMLPLDRPRELGVVETVERTGREALAEMRRMLGLLRDPGAEGVSLAPQPGLARLDELIESTRAAGVHVELAVDPTPAPLSPGLDLCAYRIVQEALTNVIKHAGAASARVGVRFPPGRLDLEIVDDGRGGAVRNRGGHGLVGMRERVALFGGQLQVGPEATRGFAVRAQLPLEAL